MKSSSKRFMKKVALLLASTLRIVFTVPSALLCCIFSEASSKLEEEISAKTQYSVFGTL